MTVIYEDNHIIIVNKTCSEIVQGDKTGDVPLSDIVKDFIKNKYQKPGNVYLGVAHRIDRPTSGIVVFAKTSKALSRLNDMFKSHELVKKTYWAIVPNVAIKSTSIQLPPIGSQTIRLENYMFRNEKQNKTYICNAEHEGSKLAKMSFRRIATGERYSLLEIDLETGRHHQIRCQLAHIGFPIKGDLKYGAKRSNPDGGICLHARAIEFTHPVSQKLIRVEAPVPNDKLWKELESEASKSELNEL